MKNLQRIEKNQDVKQIISYSDILASYTILTIGLLTFCHDREVFWGEIPKMATA